MRQGVLKAEEKIPGERALSQQLDVSRDTVRAALRELEEQGYLVRIPARGTFIRRSAIQREFKIAFVFPEPEISLIYQSYGNYASNSEIWRGIVGKCAELGGTVSFFTARPHLSGAAAQELADALMRDYSGAIFPSAEFDRVAEHLDEKGFPCVLTTMHPKCSHVFYDRELAVKMAAGHLLDNGCRTVLLLGNPGESYNQKIAVFRREFASRGLTIPDSDVVTLTDNREKLFYNVERVFSARAELPDAVFCATPIISFPLLHLAASLRWEVPGRIKLMGYANNAEQQCTIPELTHIRLPHAAIGATAAALIAARIRGGAPLPHQTLLAPELVQGETTSSIPDGRAAMQS